MKCRPDSQNNIFVEYDRHGTQKIRYATKLALVCTHICVTIDSKHTTSVSFAKKVAKPHYQCSVKKKRSMFFIQNLDSSTKDEAKNIVSATSCDGLCSLLQFPTTCHYSIDFSFFLIYIRTFQMADNPPPSRCLTEHEEKRHEDDSSDNSLID